MSKAFIYGAFLPSPVEKILMNFGGRNIGKTLAAQLELNLLMTKKIDQIMEKEMLQPMYKAINDKGIEIFQHNDLDEVISFCNKYNQSSKRSISLKEIKISHYWSEIKQIQKPEWIPALVKYQEVPKWWRMVEHKSKLMGEVILVKIVEPEETERFKAEYGQSKADYWSQRTSNGGKWFWNKADLILYPDAVEVETYASAKFAHNKGQKKAKK